MFDNPFSAGEIDRRSAGSCISNTVLVGPGAAEVLTGTAPIASPRSPGPDRPALIARP